MNKFIVLSLIVVTALAAHTFGVSRAWDNDTGNRLWSDPVNWYDFFGSGPDDVKPGQWDTAVISRSGLAIIDQPELINQVNCTYSEPNDLNHPYWTDPNYHAGIKIVSGGSLQVGYQHAYFGFVGYPYEREVGELIVDGGDFTCLSGLVLGPEGRGSIELHAGSITVSPAGPAGIWVGYHMGSNGTLTVTGGTLECWTLRVGIAAPQPDPDLPHNTVHGSMYQSGGEIIVHDRFFVSGDVHLDGGVLTTGPDVPIWTEDTSIDITYGTWKLTGQNASLQNLVNNGIITAFGGTGQVVIDYDSSQNMTTITAEGCSDPPAGDTNNDCYVDITDLADFAGSWLECTKFPNGCL